MCHHHPPQTNPTQTTFFSLPSPPSLFLYPNKTSPLQRHPPTTYFYQTPLPLKSKSFWLNTSRSGGDGGLMMYKWWWSVADCGGPMVVYGSRKLSGMKSSASAREVEDVPELMQRIQSWLPVKEAARTSVLSKSWLYAWSTIPILIFSVGRERCMKLAYMDRVLYRYLRDNIPIERFDLMMDVENQESASHAEKWIGPLATKTCLKEFSLSITLNGASFTLPDEILSGENLTKIRVSGTHGGRVPMTTSQHPVIKCVSLRELHLDCVCISEEALNHILSSCSLLVKIVLLNSCNGFNTIKVKNLPRLYELRINLNAVDSTALEISDVPNLGLFSYKLDVRFWLHDHPPPPFNASSISLGRSVTHLTLAGVITDNACLDIFKSQFPFLQSLTLYLTSWMLGSFHLTCPSIKILFLLSCPAMVIDVQVYAPKLLYVHLSGCILPSLLFPLSSLQHFKVSLMLQLPVDADFFLMMREAFELSRLCYLHISTDNSNPPLDIDIDDLRTRLLLPPATNMQELWFETEQDEGLWERSPFFDAFFEICHPKQVFPQPDVSFKQNNHFCRLMLREVLEKKNTRTAYWPHYLKHVQIRWDPHKKWKALTNSHRSLLDESTPDFYPSSN
ncbi:unnamed protein product [Lactuca saligna]|uniref:F-box/LRR-repeat protein 15/At3g58940/PEG3-like LRR domain-containing protein n=1 Tax=Lactuca saligna TaxID=75948 RepID=A0AA35VNV6_LACSI|nr:unnamed protein product [Lactuca saligna]